MLWSGCTSTFMPFFRVRVVTGNSDDCARAGDGAIPKKKAHNRNDAMQQQRFAFMNPPSEEPFHLKTYTASKMFAVIWASSRQQRKYPDRAARTTFQLDGRHDKERATLRQLAQIRQVLEMIKSRSQSQMMNGILLRRAAIDAHRVTSDAVRLALNQKPDSFGRKSREVHAPGFVLIAVSDRIRPSR